MDTSGWLGDITLTQGAAAGDTIEFAVYPGRSIDVGAAARITLGLGDTIVVTLVTEYWDSTLSEVAAQTEESEVTLVIGENPVAGVVTEAVAWLIEDGIIDEEDVGEFLDDTVADETLR